MTRRGSPARGGRVAGTAAALALVAAVTAIVILWPRGGLAARPVASVPALLSEPAGLLGEGLSLGPTGLGAVEFGTDAGAAMTALTAVLGPPIEDTAQPCRDGGEPVRSVRWGDLSVSFPGGAFSGWVIGIYYPPDSPELRVATEEGIALRASAAELAAAYGDRLAWTTHEDSGFGGGPIDSFGIDGYTITQPAAEGIGGYVEGGRDSGRVITLFAGRPCGG